MDLIKAEIERKRKEASSSLADAREKGPKKYVKRGNIEASTKASIPAAKQAARSDDLNPKPLEKSAQKAATNEPETPAASLPVKLKTIPEAELQSRLRSFGVPIRLFGESFEQRLLRLTRLESADEHERSHGGQNDFRQRLADAQLRMETALLYNVTNSDGGEDASHKSTTGEKKKRERDELLMKVETSLISPKLLNDDPEKNRWILVVDVYAQYLIGAYFKKLLHLWEQSLTTTSTSTQDTHTKLAIATQSQTAEYMKPLFSSLKKGTLEPDVMARLTEIAMRMQEREYLLANDSYLRLSIGNAPWPIGVTMVGIHERSGREKISSSLIAHGLNDETQRKWIQSIKRLMTFAQSIFPPDDLGKAVG